MDYIFKQLMLGEAGDGYFVFYLKALS